MDGVDGVDWVDENRTKRREHSGRAGKGVCLVCITLVSVGEFKCVGDKGCFGEQTVMVFGGIGYGVYTDVR